MYPVREEKQETIIQLYEGGYSIGEIISRIRNISSDGTGKGNVRAVTWVLRKAGYNIPTLTMRRDKILKLRKKDIESMVQQK